MKIGIIGAGNIVDELGFDPVDAGALRKALSEANRGRSEKIRKIAEEKLKRLSPDSPPDTFVKMSRSLQAA